MSVVDSLALTLTNFYTSQTSDKYTTINIHPEKNLTNRENLSLVNLMSSMYTPPKNRLKDFNIRSKTILKMDFTKLCYWDIVFTRGKCNFYLSFPDTHKDLLITKTRNTWKSCRVSEEDKDLVTLQHTDNNMNVNNCCVGELVLKTFNFKALSTDMSSQYPLNNLLSVIRLLNDDEYVRINIAIEPMSRFGWIQQAQDEMKRFDSGEILNNELGIKEQIKKLGFDGLKTGLDFYIEFRLLILESIFGIFNVDFEGDEKVNNKKKGRSRFSEDDDYDLTRRRSSSNYKSTAETFKTKVTIISNSKDENRARINLLATSSAYKDLTEDNELVLRIYDKAETERAIQDVVGVKTRGSKKCILCDKEVAKLIQLPQKTLQDEYRLNVINTKETTDTPKEIQGGDIRIGLLDEPSKNKKTTITLPKDSNALCKKTVLIGSENSGKTTQLKRLANDYHKCGISNIVFDHLENGKFTNEITSSLPKDKYVVYDIYEQMPSFSFTEIQSKIREDMSPMLRLDYADMIAKQVILFVNSITDDETGALTGRMKRFLHSACMAVFIKPKATINDVFNVLTNWKIRNEFIRYAKYSKLFDETDDIFVHLNELHKRNSKDGKESDEGKIVGNRDDLIAGIVNRIATLRQNPRIKQMLNKPYDENDNLDKYIQQGISVFIKVPQYHFPDNATRDMICTFYFSRLWLTAQLRKENKDSKICHVIIDEIKSLPTLSSFMEGHITEFRRNRIAMTIAVHGLQQFGKLLQQLLDAGSSFIILSPCEKKNIQALKEEILPFELEDAMTLRPHHALCVINYGNQYWRGIVKLFKD